MDRTTAERVVAADRGRHSCSSRSQSFFRRLSLALAGKTKLSRGDRCALPAIALVPRTQDHEHAKLDREAIDPWRVNWRLPAQRSVTRRARRPDQGGLGSSVW